MIPSHTKRCAEDLGPGRLRQSWSAFVVCTSSTACVRLCFAIGGALRHNLCVFLLCMCFHRAVGFLLVCSPSEVQVWRREGAATVSFHCIGSWCELFSVGLARAKGRYLVCCRVGYGQTLEGVQPFGLAKSALDTCLRGF